MSYNFCLIWYHDPKLEVPISSHTDPFPTLPYDCVCHKSSESVLQTLFCGICFAECAEVKGAVLARIQLTGECSG